MSGFSQGEAQRLRAAGFEVVGDTATVTGARVTISAPGDDGVTITDIQLPTGASLRLSVRLGKDN